MALTPPDTTEDTQVNPPVPARTIYNAGYGEIAAKSFVAGLALGLGKTVASLVFWGIIFVLSIQLIQPLIAPLITQFQQFSLLIPKTGQSSGQPSIESIFQQFQPRPTVNP